MVGAGCAKYLAFFGAGDEGTDREYLGTQRYLGEESAHRGGEKITF